jgi:hypothetical protein
MAVGFFRKAYAKRNIASKEIPAPISSDSSYYHL